MKYLLITLLICNSICIAQDQTKEIEELLDQDKYKKANKLATRAINKEPDNGELYVLRAEANRELKDWGAALNDYNHAITLEPENAFFYAERSDYFLITHQLSAAIKDIQKAREYAPDDSSRWSYKFAYGGLLISSQKYDDGVEVYEEMLEDSLTYTQDTFLMIVYNNIGLCYAEVGEVETAIDYFKKIVDIDSTFVGGYGNIGYHLSELGKYEEALYYLNKSIKLSKHHPYMLNNRGYCKYKLGDLKGALKDVNASIKISETNSYAYRNRALIYLEMGKLEKACEDMSTALGYGYTTRYGDDVKELKRKHCNF